MITSILTAFDVKHTTTEKDFKIGAKGVDSTMTITFDCVTVGYDFWLGAPLYLV